MMMGLAVPSVVFADNADNHREWNFVISLDGDPIGIHKFTVDETAGAKGAWRVQSHADFTVTLLGVPVFRYHHTAHEEWDHQCLSQLTADTNHDGDNSHVTAQGTASGGALHITTGQNDDAALSKKWDGCLMTYAYWNPDMRHQTHLLNPENGEVEAVTLTPQPDAKITSRGEPLAVHVWRLTGSTNPIDILYDFDGNWVGLDAKVRGGRVLSYRLP